jgi:outer membrane lipoprotein-sorting protein
MKLLITFLLSSFLLAAPDPSQIIEKSVKQFSLVQSYSADIDFVFDIPSVNMKNMSGQVYYKSPDKYRTKISGLAFIPNENPIKIYHFLRDKSKYNAVYEGEEALKSGPSNIVNIIPKGKADFMLGKLWIDKKTNTIVKVILTSQQGSIRMENKFGNMAKYSLPDQTIFYLDNFKPNLLKMKPSLNKKKTETATEDKIGTITMKYSNYKINIPVSDTLFSKKEKNVSKTK